MPAQTYQQVPDDDDHDVATQASAAQREVAAAFAGPSSSDSPPNSAEGNRQQAISGIVDRARAFWHTTLRTDHTDGQVSSSAAAGPSASDGVFANITAREGEEKAKDAPPTYQEVLQDPSPPSYDGTPHFSHDFYADAVYYGNLPVGSTFVFLWTAMISMVFQVAGFMLTFIFHTTQAGRCGSIVGLGITFIQYGLSMKQESDGYGPPPGPGESSSPFPSDPNSHSFDPAAADGKIRNGADAAAGAAGGGSADFAAQDLFAYALMLGGVALLGYGTGQFAKAKLHERRDLLRRVTSRSSAV